MEWRNEEFDLGGVDHLALVCSDMKRTVETGGHTLLEVE